MRRELFGVALLAALPLAATAREDDPHPAPPPAQPRATAPAPDAKADPRAWKTAIAEPKAVSPNGKKGLDWLIRHQREDGGWAQGEESEAMRGGGNPQGGDQSNVADTCIAALALIRSGSTPTEGPYKDAIARAVRFVEGKVEKSPSASESLSVTDVNGTRVQMKLGPNIDTFLASMLLSEAKGHMAAADQKGVDAALQKVIAKIEAHQKADGSFEGGGWAPVLAQAMSGKGINRARQAGARVSDLSLAQAENGAKVAAQGVPVAAPSLPTAAAPATELASATPAPTSGPGRIEGPVASTPSGLAGTPTATTPAPRLRSYAYSGRAAGGVGGGLGGRGAVGAGAAGVELYDKAASLGVLSDSVNTSRRVEKELIRKLAEAKDDRDRNEAKRALDGIADTRKVQEEAQKSVIARLDDKAFIAGFGSNGGEEFLSYMTIGESLVVKGGHEWETWDRSMADNLNRIQNNDGSWSGHHCITGRTFCTSTALLVLMTDRTPIPVDAKDKDQGPEKNKDKPGSKPGA